MTTDSALAGVDEDVEAAFPLRRGGVLALGTDYVYVARDDETTRIAVGNVVEVQHDAFDWFLGIMSVSLVGFGLYSTTKHVLGGLAFAAAGVASLYLTYRKRGKLSFRVTGRAKPMHVYPERPEDAYEALEPLMAE